MACWMPLVDTTAATGRWKYSQACMRRPILTSRPPRGSFIYPRRCSQTRRRARSPARPVMSSFWIGFSRINLAQSDHNDPLEPGDVAERFPVVTLVESGHMNTPRGWMSRPLAFALLLVCGVAVAIVPIEALRPSGGTIQPQRSDVTAPVTERANAPFPAYHPRCQRRHTCHPTQAATHCLANARYGRNFARHL